MKPFFVIGDVHGEFEMLEELLKDYDPSRETLIMLGDLIDRGERSLDVIRLAMKLKEEYGAIILMGNHETMFLEWLSEPSIFIEEHRTTLYSFFGREDVQTLTPEKLGERVLAEFSEEIAFLESLPDFFEVDEFVFVHAGVNLRIDDWKETSPLLFKWIREAFYLSTNRTPYTFVFGHTPTRLLNEDGGDSVWMKDSGTMIGIDGGAVFGGLLHALKRTEYGLINISINNHLKRTTKNL